MSLTLAAPLLVAQTGVAVILPFHLSVINHPSLSPFTTQQCVHQDLQEETWCFVSVFVYALVPKPVTAMMSKLGA